MKSTTKKPREGLKRTKESRHKKGKRPKKERLYTQRIFRDWCKACGICSAFCPRDVIGCNDGGVPVIERPDACIGCRFCELHCPDFAITVVERGEGEEVAQNVS